MYPGQMPDVQSADNLQNRSGTFAGRERSMRKIGWVKIAVAASVVISGVLVAAPAAPALADAPPPPPVINMSNVPSQYSGAVQAFETNAVGEVLTDHSLPSSDANSVLAWGRDDVRAQEWVDLDKIISEPAASRSSNDQAVYNWFQGVDQQQEAVADQDAVNEYLKWSGDPNGSITDGDKPLSFGPNGTGYCNYEPPGGETGPFAGTYTDNQDQDCYTPCTDFVTDCAPAYPSVDQFQQWGLYDADEAQTNTPDYYSAMVGTSVSMGVGLTAALGSLALPFGTAIDASALSGTAIQEAVFPFAARVGVWVAQAARLGTTSAELASDVAPEVAAGAEVAGAIAFVAGIAVFFIISTVLASITLAQNAAEPGQLAALLNPAAPDLASQASTSDGYGSLYSMFIAQTLPEADLSCTSGQNLVQDTLCANAPAIPAPASTDPLFQVTANGITTPQRSIYSVDPGGYFDKTYMSGNGWFVTQKFDPTDTNNATSPTDGGATIQSLSFPYTDWAGNNYFAERVTVNGQPMFDITPVDSSNSNACAIPQGSTTTPCLTTAIQFQEPNGTGTPIDATAQLEPASASAPTAVASFPATVQIGQSVTFNATPGSSDPNNLPLTYSWQLPTQLVNNSIACDFNSPCVTTLTGPDPSYTFTLPGVYHGTLTATNSVGNSSTESFTVAAAGPTTTTVSSSANPSVYGQPVTLTADVAPTLVGGDGSFAYPPVTGDVQFLLNDQPLGQPVALQPPSGCGSPCSLPDGTASITLPKLSVTPAGLHGADLSVRFLGSSYYTTSGEFLQPNGQVVNQASTTTTLTSSVNPSVTGQPITFTASVAPVAPGAGLPTGTVQFQFNGQNVGLPVALDSTGTATYVWTPAHATQGGLFLIGYHSAEAVYSGDSNFAGSSGGADQSVLPDPTTTTVTSSANPSNYLQPVTFTATVAAASPGSGTPTGQVQFSFDGTPVGSPVSLDANGDATLTTDATDALGLTGIGTSFPTGHAISAQYLGASCNGCLYFVPDYGQSTGTLNPGGAGQDVSQPALVIAASSPTVTYGDPAPAITPGYSGFVTGDSPASLTTAPACATTYQQGNGVGSYPATCQGAADPAYEIIYAGGAVTVAPATLTVTAKNASMLAGGSPPSYGFALSGFIGSDGPSSLTTQPTCVADDPATGNPVSSSTPAGTYPITCTGAAAANYGFSYVPGTLTSAGIATSLVYTGGQTVVAGSSFSAQALVSSPAAVCLSGQPVSFSLDRNPATGVTGSYPLGSATSSAERPRPSVATTGWQQGVYVITASAASERRLSSRRRRRRR